MMMAWNKRLLSAIPLFFAIAGLRSMETLLAFSQSFIPDYTAIPASSQSTLLRTDATHEENCTGTQRLQSALDNQNYTWYGNHWIPPPGVPTYTQEDMRRVFSQFDTLWIGDSTTRRAFATTFAVINSTSSSVSVEALDHPRVLDVNKYLKQGYRDKSCRRHQQNAKKTYLKPGTMDIWGPKSLCRRVGNRKFDFTRLECFHNLSQIAELTWEMQHYSLIIIGMGIFDILVDYCGSCPDDDPSAVDSEISCTNLEHHTQVALLAAQKMATTMQEGNSKLSGASPMAVLWRTPGFHGNSSRTAIDNTLRVQQMGIKFIDEMQRTLEKSTLGLIDWGRAVWPRSFYPQREKADIDAHYSLEPRLLMAQMTTQQLMKILEN